MLQAGDPIPEFALASTQGGEVSSLSLRGKRYVLYFYPKDDTPGCTTEACNFRDTLPRFEETGTLVYGVSPDDIAAHEKFIAKHALNFPLLADPERKLIEAVGVWVEKSMYGKKYMGVQRSTFVVGPDGRIEKVWPKVTPDGHAREVLEYLRAGTAMPADYSSSNSDAATPSTPVTKENTGKSASGKSTAQRASQATGKASTRKASRK